MTNKILWGVAIVALLLGGYAVLRSSSNSPALGAVSGMLAENYDPYIRTNGGYNSALPIKTTSTFSSGSATVTGFTVTTSNTATSTAAVGCVQTYATSTATPIHLEYSTTTSLATYSGGSAPNGGVSWRYGSCPV